MTDKQVSITNGSIALVLGMALTFSMFAIPHGALFFGVAWLMFLFYYIPMIHYMITRDREFQMECFKRTVTSLRSIDVLKIWRDCVTYEGDCTWSLRNM